MVGEADSSAEATAEMKIRRYTRIRGRRRARAPYRRRAPIRRRRVAKRRVVPRKKVLNITSVKKRDNMIPAQKANGESQTIVVGGTTISSATGTRHIYGWQPTARDNTVIPGDHSSPFDESSRSKSSCFMRGLRERVFFEGRTPAPVIWRRIVFAFTGQEIVRDQVTGAVSTLFAELNPQGYVRLTVPIQTGTTVPVAYLRDNLTNILFRGREQLDWEDPLIAKVDHSRVKLISDRTMTLKSGNQLGVMTTKKRWYPFNKTLIYNDDESAGGKNASFFSANNRQSMGDVYVIDIFGLVTGSETELVFKSEATLYWHER